jgi:short-subunit dehydrogenase/acyl carrier protein/acyl dehydratase
MNNKNKKIDKKFNDFSVGEYVVFKKLWDKNAFKLFSSISGDNNPLHHDKMYAAETSFKYPIVPLHMATAPLSAIAGMMLPGHRSLYLVNNVRAIDAVPYNEEITYSAKIINLNKINSALDIRVLILHKERILIVAEMLVQVRDDVPSNFTPSHDSLTQIHSQKTPLVLVTGALGGIGRSVCQFLAKKGIGVLLHHRTGRENEASDLAEKCNKFGVIAHPISANLEDKESLDAMMKYIIKNEPVTGLIHLASSDVYSSLEKSMMVNFQVLSDILDVFTPIWLAQQQGRAVVVGSSAIEYAPKGWENYIAAKVTTSHYLLAWHRRYMKYGVEGRVVSPGYVQTAFSDDLRPKDADALLPEQAAEVIVDAMIEDDGEREPYLWLENSGMRRGNWGFYEQTSQNKSGSSGGVLDSSNDNFDSNQIYANELVRKFFNLSKEHDIGSLGINTIPEWDSLSHIELMLFLEKKLEISFDSQEIEKTKTLVSLEKLISEKLIKD